MCGMGKREFSMEFKVGIKLEREEDRGGGHLEPYEVTDHTQNTGIIITYRGGVKKNKTDKTLNICSYCCKESSGKINK